jgi:hypothetical protein
VSRVTDGAPLQEAQHLNQIVPEQPLFGQVRYIWLGSF